MEANELRVTNFVMSDGIEMPVAMIGVDAVQLFTPQGNVIHARLDLIKPIELTEEWLIKFGFKKFKNHNDWSIKGFIIHGRKRGFVLRKSTPVIKYVHTLQNLYFALTGGEELKIK